MLLHSVGVCGPALWCSAALILLGAAAAPSAPRATKLPAHSVPRHSHVDTEPQVYSLIQLREFPHEGLPWTQGLEMRADGDLVETSGDYPPGKGSQIRVLDATTGAVKRWTSEGLRTPQGAMFIEGIVELHGRWFATTYQDKMAIEYDADFKPVASHPFPWEGWGLTRSADGSSLIATNSTQSVMILSPETFEVTRVMTATCLGKQVKGLNELEMVENFGGEAVLMGNLINSRLVMLLDPGTMKCRGIFHMEGLEKSKLAENWGYHVANGIAYNSRTGTLFLTGKNWQSMFEARLEELDHHRARDSRARMLLERYLLNAAQA